MFSGWRSSHGLVAAPALGTATTARVSRDRRTGTAVRDLAASLPGDRVHEPARAVDLDAHRVAAGQELRRRLPGAHARGRAGEDQVAGLQRDRLGEEGDDLRHAEDEV